ncbi:gluconokinase [Colwellia sp. 20A7]|uniref:gluconokinase n=1 Tax=Colwellia sp. 20A7 TaxID=2689569 RepID=UPI00135BEC6F|nr:gluconokinase, GntK/IdnK-type [Colwellia sp. 20A7]
MINILSRNKKPKFSSIPHLFIIMGVSGSGKTEISQKLVNDLNTQGGYEFLDADDFHSSEAIALMAANLPLNDTMRKPWVEAIISKLGRLSKQNKNVVLAFSGLKYQHRKRFRTLEFKCHFYYLSADLNTIKNRMLNRENHFFKVELLTSQFAAMEEKRKDEKDIVKLDVSGTFKEVYQKVYQLVKKDLSKS